MGKTDNPQEIYVVTWGDLKKASAAEVWQLCAAAVQLKPIKDPREMKQFLCEAVWASKAKPQQSYYRTYFSDENLQVARSFCARVELVSMTLAGGNIFGALSVDEFVGLANAAGWELPKCFKVVGTRKKGNGMPTTVESLEEAERLLADRVESGGKQ